MKLPLLSLAIATTFALSAPVAFAQNADGTSDTGAHKRVSVVAGYGILKPKSDAFGSDPDRGLKGGGLPTASVAYHITDNIAVEAWGAVDKAEHKVAGAGIGGRVKAQPYGISGQYHFGHSGQAIRPYVGLGYYQANISGERDVDGQHFGMSTPKGAMGTVGADFNINDRWFTRAEARYMDGKSDVTRAGLKVGEAQIDPWLVGVGIGARF
ncbi:MAG: outer membrane beta-barrel protein [Xanthomonadaceae bacterium]|nr:outer membrane beta-barrel protein [Xanthomonadaceae bacterium]